MTTEYEKKIFSQDLMLSTNDIEKIIEDYFRKAIDAHNIKWGIEMVGIKQILVIYRDNIVSPENKIRNGYFEINPLQTQSEKPVHLKVVSFRSELDFWWLNLSQVIQSVSITPDFPPSLVMGISRELLTEIPKSSLPERGPKPNLPIRPQVPEVGSESSNWFKYYYECKKARYKVTLKEIADLSGYRYGYVRLMHLSYKIEQGYSESKAEPKPKTKPKTKPKVKPKAKQLTKQLTK